MLAPRRQLVPLAKGMSPVIRFACPACKAVMEAPAQKVGRKINCLQCGQRLQIPPPPHGTILATPLPLPGGPASRQPPADPFAGIEKPEHLAGSPRQAPRPPIAGDGSRNRTRGSRFWLGISLICVGVLPLCLGLCLVPYFWLVYDTSVPVYPGWETPDAPRVHNTGLMQNRTIGVLVGFGCLTPGIALAVVGLVLLVRSRTTRPAD